MKRRRHWILFGDPGAELYLQLTAFEIKVLTDAQMGLTDLYGPRFQAARRLWRFGVVGGDRTFQLLAEGLRAVRVRSPRGLVSFPVGILPVTVAAHSSASLTFRPPDLEHASLRRIFLLETESSGVEVRAIFHGKENLIAVSSIPVAVFSNSATDAYLWGGVSGRLDLSIELYNPKAVNAKVSGMAIYHGLNSVENYLRLQAEWRERGCPE